MRLLNHLGRDAVIVRDQRLLAVTWRLLSVSITLFCAGVVAAQTKDPRLPPPEHTRQWQHAMGHLQVPTTRMENGRRRHFAEHCSATSVTPGPRPIFLTAWHCLDGYDSLLEPILLIIGQREPVRLRVLESGGSMVADWAILRADEPIEDLHWIPISIDRLRIGTKVNAAGFAPASTQSGDAQADPSTQRQLLVHANCEVINNSSSPAISNCVARPGASGGAILSRTDSGSVRLSGVISAGDSESVVLYHPTAALFGRVQSLR